MSLSDLSSIGMKISLLSNSGIRYEGYLSGLDQVKNTVSLRDVTILGTEGRNTAVGKDEVLPSTQIFELIVFRGSDIHDLTVYENGQLLASVDPAIVSATPASNNATAAAAVVPPQQHQPQQLSNGGRGGGRGFYDEAPARQGNHNYNTNSSNRFHSNSSAHNAGGGGGRGYGGRGRGGGGYGGRGRGGGQYRRRHDSHTGMDFLPASDARKEEFQEEFDFEKARREFERNKKEFTEAKEEAKHHNKAYDKSSFFDNIGNDQKDRGTTRMDRDEMKKADTETFGSEMVGRMNPGGFRRGGRGGRGRYNRY